MKLEGIYFNSTDYVTDTLRRHIRCGHTTMELQRLVTDERAVSPVIGVILMVAITVILAAVIGTFVLGLGQGVSNSPDVTLDFEYGNDGSNDVVNVTHNGGDRIEVGENADSVRVTASNNSTAWIDADGESIAAGDTASPLAYGSSDTVRVVWFDTTNESSATLGESDVPA